MTTKIKKPDPLKARGIRFDDDKWARLEAIAKRDKSNRVKPSDLVRQAVDEFLKKIEKT